MDVKQEAINDIFLDNTIEETGVVLGIVKNMKKDMKEYAKKYKQVKTSYTDKDNELKELSSKYANLESELKRYIASHNDFKARYESLENDHNIQLNASYKKHQSQCQEIDNLTTTCDQLRSQLEQLEKKEKESAETIKKLKHSLILVNLSAANYTQIIKDLELKCKTLDEHESDASDLNEKKEGRFTKFESEKITYDTEKIMEEEFENFKRDTEQYIFSLSTQYEEETESLRDELAVFTQKELDQLVNKKNVAIQTDVDDGNELLAAPKNFEQVSIREEIADPMPVSLKNNMVIEEENVDMYELSETRNVPALIHMIPDTKETPETDSMKTEPLKDNYSGKFVKIRVPSQSGAFRIKPDVCDLSEDDVPNKKIKSNNKNTMMKKRNTLQNANKMAQSAILHSKKKRSKFFDADKSVTVLSSSHLTSCAHSTNTSHSTKNHMSYHTCHDNNYPLPACSNMYSGCNNCCALPAYNYSVNQLRLRTNGHENDQHVRCLTQTTQSQLRDLHVDRRKKNRQMMNRKLKLRRRKTAMVPSNMLEETVIENQKE